MYFYNREIENILRLTYFIKKEIIMIYSCKDLIKLQKQLEQDNQEGHVLNERRLILKLLDIVIQQQGRIENLEMKVLL